MDKQSQEQGHVFAEKYVALPLSADYQAPLVQPSSNFCARV